MDTGSSAEHSDRARERVEILDGLLAAFDNRGRLFDALDASEDADAARAAVMRELGLTEVQATAVLDLQVRRFVPQQRERMARERNDLARAL